MTDQPIKNLGKGIIIFLSVLLMITIAGFITLGQQIWIQQEKITTDFESCMEQAPFRSSINNPEPFGKILPNELENHFAEFDRIFKETGLPPIWNGNQLIPWKVYHKESIIFASECHEKLGITKPQKQLRGTYSKAIWDPKSDIWLGN